MALLRSPRLCRYIVLFCFNFQVLESYISRDVSLSAEKKFLFHSLVEKVISMDSMIPPNSIHSVLNNGTSNSIANPASSSQLSWQSALSSLVALALNTMTQSSPSSHSLFSDLFSLLRASPIICLADLLFMLLWLAKLTLISHQRSVTAAMKKVTTF